MTQTLSYQIESGNKGEGTTLTVLYIAATMENFSVEQKAYHLRKMKTRYARLDVDNDAHITLADYELMAKRMVEHGKLSKDKAEMVYEKFRKMAELTGCGNPGERLALNKAINQAHESLLTLPDDEWKQMHHSNAGELFHAVDTNSDGVISVDEFAVFFMAVGLTREESKRSFGIIDTDKNGEISYEEFMKAAEDFYRGTEETELSKAFFGPLVD